MFGKTPCSEIPCSVASPTTNDKCLFILDASKLFVLVVLNIGREAASRERARAYTANR